MQMFKNLISKVYYCVYSVEEESEELDEAVDRRTRGKD